MDTSTYFGKKNLFWQGGSLTLRVWLMAVGGAAATVILDRFSKLTLQQQQTLIKRSLL